jgi:hypothetical protein
MDYVTTPFPLILPGITCHAFHLDDSDSQKLGELLSEHRVFRPLSHYSRRVRQVESAHHTLHCASSDRDEPSSISSPTLDLL